MRQPKRVAAKILEELASSLEAAFEAAAIESARVGLADDAHDLTQRIVRSTAKRKGVMRKAADLLADVHILIALRRKARCPLALQWPEPYFSPKELTHD